MDVVLGIDIGTSGVRIAAVRADLSIAAMTTRPLPSPVQVDGHVRQDASLWWQAVGEALADLDLHGLTVKAIAVDGTSGTILPITSDGRPLALASLYNDVAEPAGVAGVAAIAPEDTAARGSTSPLARALAMQTGASRIIHQADWIVGQFCARFDTTDENNALKTGYDPVARRWPDWIGRTGFDMALLPAVVPAGTAIAPILPAVASNFGLPRDTVIVAGTTDGCAAFLASGASRPGDGVTSLGTTLTIKLLSDRPVFAPAYGIYSHRIGDQWLAGGASNTGGAVLARFFRNEDLARLTPLLDPENPTGLDYYPLVKPGERFPVNDPALPPRLEPRPADDRIFFQAILEGMTAIEKMAYARLVELGASPLTSIRTTGGGASNPAWRRMRQKALAVPELPCHSEHAAVGTARLAWRGIGHAAH